MAQQTEAIFNLKVNTGNSVEDVEKLDKAIKDTQTTAGTGKGVEDFAKKLDALDKQLAEGNLTMRQRSKLVREYQQIALQAGETSPVGERAVRSAAALSDEIADMNQRVRMLASDTVKLDTALQGISVGASVFQGVQSAMALTGVENEELIKSMQKLQAVQGVTNAIQQVTNALNKDAILGIQLRVALEKAKNFVMTGSIAGTKQLAVAETQLTTSSAGATAGTTGLAASQAGLTTSVSLSTIALRALRLALIATGIGAIIVAVGLLVTNFDKVTKVVKDAYNRFNELGKGVKIALAVIFPFIGAIYGVVKALQYMGVIDTDVNAKMKANAEERSKMTEKEMNTKIKAEQRKKNAIEDTMGFEIQMAKASGKETTKMERDKLKASLDAGRGILAMQKEKMNSYKSELALLKQLGDGDSKRAKDLKKLIGETNKALSEQYKENVSNSRSIKILYAETEKNKKDKAKESHDKRMKLLEEERKRREALAKFQRDAINSQLQAEEELDEKIRQLQMTDQQRELDAIQEKYFQLKTQAELAGRDTTAIEQAELAERNAVNKKYADEALKIQMDKDLKRVEQTRMFTLLIEDQYQDEINQFKWSQEDQLTSLQQALKDKTITQEQYDAGVLQMAKDLSEKEKDVEKKKQDDLKAIRDKAFQQQIQAVERVIEIVQQSANVLKGMNDLMNASDNERLKQLEGNEKEQEKIRRKIFERDKKLRMLQVAIDTASAITKSVAASPTTFGLPFSAFAGVTGALQLATIAKSTFDGGAQIASASPQQLSAPVQSQQISTAELPETEQPQGQQTVKVVVLENDITNIQQRVKVAENLSSF